jgi:hypothetical protein
MDQCVTEIPPLRQVAGSADHRSACWLPVDEVGLSDDVDRKREQVALARRGALAAESSDVIDDSDVPDGSAADVPAEEVAGTTGRGGAKPLASTSATRVRAPAGRGGRVGQPAPPARPQQRAAAGEPVAKKAPATVAKKAATRAAKTAQAPAKAAAKKATAAKKTASRSTATKNGRTS